MRQKHPCEIIVGQCGSDKFSPTKTKFESWTGDSTAITRQFTQSSPSIDGSIWTVAWKLAAMRR